MSKEFNQELIEEKNRMRLAMRNEYLKKISNPHTEAGGHLFDPAVQRFLSMKATRIEHFKETPKSIRSGIIYLVIPIGLTMYYYKKKRDEMEASLRAGKVAYKDRLFKFV